MFKMLIDALMEKFMEKSSEDVYDFTKHKGIALWPRLRARISRIKFWDWVLITVSLMGLLLVVDSATHRVMSNYVLHVLASGVSYLSYAVDGWRANKIEAIVGLMLMLTGCVKPIIRLLKFIKHKLH